MITQKAVHSCQLSGCSVRVVSCNHYNKLQKNTTILFSVRASLKEAFSRTPAFDFIKCRQFLNFILLQIGDGLRNHRTLQLNYMFTIIGNIACACEFDRYVNCSTEKTMHSWFTTEPALI